MEATDLDGDASRVQKPSHYLRGDKGRDREEEEGSPAL